MECRTCLATGVPLIKLDKHLEDGQTLLNFLLFCTRLENIENFSNKICIECSRALEISFIFIKNALTANAILMERAKQSSPEDVQAPSTSKTDQSGAVKFRCKICQEKLESKSALKNHFKLHMDVITYRCQLCDFDCKKRTHLSEHYNKEHNIEPSSIQLKPLMQRTTIAPNNKEQNEEEFIFENEESNEKLMYLERLEERKREDEEAKRILQELEENLTYERRFKTARTSITHVVEETQAMEELDRDAVGINQAIASEDALSLGNEFLVMPDGTLQKIDGSGIVIEYVDEDVANVTNNFTKFLDGNELIVDNTVQIDASCNTNLEHMDVTDIIEETIENPNKIDTPIMSTSSVQNSELPTTSSDTYNKQNYCKICNQVFGTRSELKIHMLTHSEIPHFFCDRCSFYTFFKNDLTQHYKSKHHVHPSIRQLQPKNKSDTNLGAPVYSCDLCFFETAIRLDLQHHYLRAHKIKANDVQLRPTVDNTDINLKRSIVVNKRNTTRESSKFSCSSSKTIICKLCKKHFNTQGEYREHLLWHKQEKKNEALRRLLETDTKSLEKELQRTRYETTTTALPIVISNANTTAFTANNTFENNNIAADALSAVAADNVVYQQNVMHIENNVILPMEAIPQVIASEQTIAPDGQMDFDFNGDDIFEDFDNVNDNNDELDDELSNLVLTSEDDLDDLIEEGDEKNVNENIRKQQLTAYCVQCNKRFFSQYQFENHMFVHRGLVPYRCEMCTNLYNKKRALIKHYKVVHKRMPTRDMIQAKGDKVQVSQSDIGLLDLENTKAGTLMCVKCPFESTELLNLQLHLSNTHGIIDQNFVLPKLTYECPRCIRSFETKSRLKRHLERNHSQQKILEKFFNSNNSNVEQATTISTVSTTTTTYNSEISLKPSEQQQQETTMIETVQQPQHHQDSYSAQYEHHQDQSTTIQTASSTTSGIVEQQLQQQQQQQQEKQNSNILQPPQLFFSHQQEDFNNLNIAGEETSTTPPPPPPLIETIIETSISSAIYEVQSQSATMEAADSFCCNICHNKYKSELLLKFHMKRHLERKFRCEFCPKSFITRTDLDTHTTRHTGNLRYKCEICDRKFGYAHHLKRHRETIHFGKRFFCSTSDCGKEFSSKTQLNIHRREHDGTKPFQCPYCERIFNRREYFRQHALKTHNIRLSEAEIAEVYRATTGYCNPHDLLVVANEGKFIRRSDVEAYTVAAAVSNIPIEEKTENYAKKEEIITEEATNT